MQLNHCSSQAPDIVQDGSDTEEHWKLQMTHADTYPSISFGIIGRLRAFKETLEVAPEKLNAFLTRWGVLRRRSSQKSPSLLPYSIPSLLPIPLSSSLVLGQKRRGALDAPLTAVRNDTQSILGHTSRLHGHVCRVEC